MARAAGTSKGDILRAFAELVANVGYDETTFREVAEALGISKGTIVHHYGTKEYLLEAVHREYMERRLREAHAILDATSGPSAQLTAMIAQLIIVQRDDRDATVTFAREITRFSSLDVMKDVRRMRAQYTALVHDIIAAGVETGEFVDADVDLVTLQIFGMCNWAWTWWRPSQAWSVEDVVDSWTRTILSGLRAGRSGKKVDVPAIVTLVAQTVADISASVDRTDG